MIYRKSQNVYDEAVERISMIFDTHDDVIVSMSGGKDSTVVFNMARNEAEKRGRLPLKVLWLDQEAEWQHTVDHMDKIMRRPDVKPYWFQIPFDFTNSLSHNNNFLHLWDPAEKDKWIHPQSDISIKENPTKHTRFHPILSDLHRYCTDSDNCAVLTGMRIQESHHRRMAIVYGNGKFRGHTWCTGKKDRLRLFFPIYDFDFDDIWIAIARNGWEYNKIYDLMYRYGVRKNAMRVSALIHETAWGSMYMLHEFEPVTYDRFTRRVPGAGMMDKLDQFIPKELPFAFRDAKEYRDYLLEKLVKPEYWEHFRNEWKNQDSEEWYWTHISECIVNDIDGTLNGNVRSAKKVLDMRKDDSNKYKLRDEQLFREWKESHNDNQSAD